MTFVKAIHEKKVEIAQCCFWNGLKIILQLLLNKQRFCEGNTKSEIKVGWEELRSKKGHIES